MEKMKRSSSGLKMVAFLGCALMLTFCGKSFKKSTAKFAQNLGLSFLFPETNQMNLTGNLIPLHVGLKIEDPKDGKIYFQDEIRNGQEIALDIPTGKNISVSASYILIKSEGSKEDFCNKMKGGPNPQPNGPNGQNGSPNNGGSGEQRDEHMPRRPGKNDKERMEFYAAYAESIQPITSATETLNVTFSGLTKVPRKMVGITVMNGGTHAGKSKLSYFDPVSKKPIKDPCTGQIVFENTSDKGLLPTDVPFFAKNAIGMRAEGAGKNAEFIVTRADSPTDNFFILDLASGKYRKGVNGPSFLGDGMDDGEKISKKISPYFPDEKIEFGANMENGKLVVRMYNNGYDYFCKMENQGDFQSCNDRVEFEIPSPASVQGNMPTPPNLVVYGFDGDGFYLTREPVKKPITPTGGMGPNGGGQGGCVPTATTPCSPSGDYDFSFNGTGFKIISLNTAGSFASVAIQNDGLAFIGGWKQATPSYKYPQFARIDSNGTLDVNFNSTGLSTIDLMSASKNHEVKTVKIAPNGSLIAGILCLGCNGAYDDSRILKVSAAGGNAGALQVSMANEHLRISDMAPRSDNNIALAFDLTSSGAPTIGGAVVNTTPSSVNSPGWLTGTGTGTKGMSVTNDSSGNSYFVGSYGGSVASQNTQIIGMGPTLASFISGFGASGMKNADLSVGSQRDSGNKIALVNNTLIVAGEKDAAGVTSISISKWDLTATSTPTQTNSLSLPDTAAVTSMIVTSDQNFIVVGGFTTNGAVNKPFLAKFKISDLTVEPSFGGGNGYVVFGNFPNNGVKIRDMALASTEGRIYAVGEAHNGTIWEPIVMKFFP